mmetsp:Transcript_25375/g.29382  ORF Transcript_25375/g.29382 Transcript_25375/m.29382 type:complete len:662 (-) Transcript_25375:1156-3141(-)
MSNPRLMAEDIASHYAMKLNPHYPHAKNVRRHLRSPVLALTRRILLPRINYAEVQYLEAGSFGGNSHIDPTFLKCKEGLDWRDYASEVPRSDSTDSGEIHSETEPSDSDDNHRNMDLQQYYGQKQPKGEMKLSRRSLARMESFLASCSLSAPNDPILPLVPSSRRMQNSPSNKKQANNTSRPSFMTSLHSLAISFTEPIKKNGNHTPSQAIANASCNKGKKSFSQITSKALSHNNKKNAKNTKHSHKYPQIHIDDLTFRLELYIRTLRRIYALREQLHEKEEQKKGNSDNYECVISFEPQRAIRARIQLTINSLIGTTNSVGSMRPTLTNLLMHLTRELLAVEHLSDSLSGYVRKIVLEYEHLTSFASLAFLSSPDDSANEHLSPLLGNYLDYLKNKWELFVEECKLESTLSRAIQPNMRKVFKTTEFRSIGHLLEVCHGFKNQLESIVISSPKNNISFGGGGGGDFNSSHSSSSPHDIITSVASGDELEVEKCNPSTTKAIKQALLDLRREIITVNGYLLPPAQSLTELVKLLRERLNSRTVRLREKKVGQSKKIGKVANKKDISSDSSDNAEIDSNTSYNTDSDLISSGNEGDADDSPIAFRKKKAGNGGNQDSNDGTPSQEVKSKRRHFNVDAIDIMTRRLLISASRTGSGGDAFFVV